MSWPCPVYQHRKPDIYAHLQQQHLFLMLYVVEKQSPMNKGVKVKLDTANNMIDKA
jgi:hypothetical protein